MDKDFDLGSRLESQMREAFFQILKLMTIVLFLLKLPESNVGGVAWLFCELVDAS